MKSLYTYDLKSTERLMSKTYKSHFYCVCQGALEHGQQLRVYREQLQKTVQELQGTQTRCDSLNRQIDQITQQARHKVEHLQF